MKMNNIKIPLSEVLDLFEKGSSREEEYWNIQCEKGHTWNWHNEDWTEEDAIKSAENHPFCQQDGTKYSPVKTKQVWWSPPHLAEEEGEDEYGYKFDKFLRKYAPEYFEGEPEDE